MSASTLILAVFLAWMSSGTALGSMSQGGEPLNLTKDAFGNVVSDTNPGLDAYVGFAGGLQDRDTGLVRFGYRDYLPDVGRWTARDPIGLFGGSFDLYTYAGNTPVNSVDRNGLVSLWEVGEAALDFTAGVANAFTFGLSTGIAELVSSDEDAAIIRQTKNCSRAFTAGEWASLALGIGRLAYAGISKGVASIAARGATMSTAETAVGGRNVLKKVFRLNPWSTFRIRPFANYVSKYGSAEAIVRAAGRTNPLINQLGGIAALGGAATLATCDCPE